MPLKRFFSRASKQKSGNADLQSSYPVSDRAGYARTWKAPHSRAAGPLWMRELFRGKTDKKSHHRLEIIRNGTIINEYSLDGMTDQLNIGCHPKANIQLESAKMSLFHATITKRKKGYFLQSLSSEADIWLNEQRLTKQAMPLRDGYIAKLPGFHLRLILPDYPSLPAETITLNKMAEMIFKPVDFPRSKAGLPLADAIENRQSPVAWTEGSHTLFVADIIDETADSKTFRLVGESPLLFSYKPGQFITLLLSINGRKIQRSYSMSSSPSRPHTLDITVKRVPGGLVSNWLCDELKSGSQLQVKGPSGRFTCLDYPTNKLLFIAAGSGITPLMSMARWITDTAATVDVKMLISSKMPQDVMFHKELELMSERYSNFQAAVTITANGQGNESWSGLTGRINRQMIESLAPDFKDCHVFICGPDNFMQVVEKMLRDLDFPMSQLHSESFGVAPVAPSVAAKDKSGKGKYQIRFNKTDVVAHADGETLLEVAQSHGVEIEHSCRAGSCGVCMVKCEGPVELNSDCEMDEKDRNAGYVFACCTKALGDLEIEA